MTTAMLLLAPAALGLSALLTYGARRWALSHGLLDVPNARSSHSEVVPRGGGIAVVATTTLAVGLLGWFGFIERGLFLALAVGGGAVAAVGFFDDRHRLPARWRLTVHVVAAIWAVYWVGGLGAVRVGQHLTYSGWIGTGLAILGVVWVLNLFNFMDGIDGIAAGEAVFVALAGAMLALAGGNSGVADAAWVFAWACAGFLCWNWPPARVFLGDVGSGYLGYVVIVLALADATSRPVAVWEWFILGTLFFADSTITLLRRLFRGDRVYEAHRQHAYQRLARRWGSHLRVTALVLGVDILWLLPCAIWAAARPACAILIAFLAGLPLVLGAWVVGAGRQED
jgi:Fuc2NAc and GlcNAc transferase